MQSVVDQIIADGFGPILFADGFRLQRAKSFVKKIGKKDKQALGVLLNRVRGRDAVYLQVCPSTTYDDVQALAAALEGIDLRKGWPTLAANIGNLWKPPRYLEWLITPETDVMAQGLVISRCIEEITFPFWALLSTLDGFIEACEPGHPYTGVVSNDYMWTVAAAQCVAGNAERAKLVQAAHESEYGTARPYGKPDPNRESKITWSPERDANGIGVITRQYGISVHTRPPQQVLSTICRISLTLMASPTGPKMRTTGRGSLTCLRISVVRTRLTSTARRLSVSLRRSLEGRNPHAEEIGLGYCGHDAVFSWV